jgi:hypothetical protein
MREARDELCLTSNITALLVALSVTVMADMVVSKLSDMNGLVHWMLQVASKG